MRHSCLNILLLTYREVLSLIIHNTKKKGSQKLFKIKVITNETVVFDGSDGGGGPICIFIIWDINKVAGCLNNCYTL